MNADDLRWMSDSELIHLLEVSDAAVDDDLMLAELHRRYFRQSCRLARAWLAAPRGTPPPDFPVFAWVEVPDDPGGLVGPTG